jgi:hypothetical protein
MEYFPLPDAPALVQRIFHAAHRLWLENYHTYVWITAIPMVIAWIGALLGLTCWVLPRIALCGTLTRAGVDKLTGPILASSALLLYEDLATAMFSQPHYRYFHITEPWRLVVGGFGLAFATGIGNHIWRTRWEAAEASVVGAKHVAEAVGRVRGWIASIQRDDLLETSFGSRRGRWYGSIVGLNVVLFGWWTASMASHTWGPPSEAKIRVVEGT